MHCILFTHLTFYTNKDFLIFGLLSWFINNDVGGNWIFDKNLWKCLLWRIFVVTTWRQNISSFDPSLVHKNRSNVSKLNRLLFMSSSSFDWLAPGRELVPAESHHMSTDSWFGAEHWRDDSVFALKWSFLIVCLVFWSVRLQFWINFKVLVNFCHECALGPTLIWALSPNIKSLWMSFVQRLSNFRQTLWNCRPKSQFTKTGWFLGNLKIIFEMF